MVCRDLLLQVSRRTPQTGMHHVLGRCMTVWIVLVFCRYYKPETKGLDFEGLMEDIKVCVGLAGGQGVLFTDSTTILVESRREFVLMC